MRIRLFLHEVLSTDVRGNAEGLQLPPECNGWEPFQVETRAPMRPPIGPEPHPVYLAIWLRQ